MRKIEKNNASIPLSLNSKRTNQSRNELIEKGTWINVDIYLSRYKETDIRKELEIIYNCKCAYCEQRIESYHIEHFRPKSIYFWLAYSWDNLMYCCPTCNVNKTNTFKVNKRATINDVDITDIHNLTEKYNEIEGNWLIHPELEDVSTKITFTKNGKIESTDARVNYTIETCKLNREKLLLFRKPIYETFEKEILARKNNKAKLKQRIKEFKEETKDKFTEFTMFRKYIETVLIKDILSDD